MYIYIYLYLSISIYIYLHLSISIYIYLRASYSLAHFPLLPAGVSGYLSTYELCVYIYNKDTCMYIYIHIFTYIYIHTYIYTYKYIHCYFKFIHMRSNISKNCLSPWCPHPWRSQRAPKT